MRSCSISLALVLALAGCKPEAASVEFRPVRTVVVDAKPILEITMPMLNLSGMTIEALMDLREQVDETLLKRRAALNGSWKGWMAAQG
jgi:hypothetical protein